jgi:SAM-dependent methyltransferase
MPGKLIDWQVLMQLAWPPAIGQATMWDRFARRYDGYARLSEPYVPAQLKFMALQPGETLLDVGAGPGRLSIPAALQGCSVTALDVSSGMLEELQRNAHMAGAEGIRTLRLAWEDVRPGDNLPPHDVVLLARSPAMSDLAKVDALSRRAAYIMVYCGPSLKSFHDELVAGIEPGPPASRHSGLRPHVLVFNQLIDMGIEAHVDYLADGFDKWYPTEDALLKDFTWLQLPAASEERLRRNLAPWLQPEDGGVRLKMETRTAVVWWHK